jgi:arsenate reductase (glutaredoxin)
VRMQNPLRPGSLLLTYPRTVKNVTIYHNPRCSKSREALRLLRAHGIEPKVIEYLVDPPSATKVKELIDLIGVEPHALLRKGEAPYKTLGLSPKSSKAEVARAIAEHPILLERPVIVTSKRAVIGRPPERALEIL